MPRPDFHYRASVAVAAPGPGPGTLRSGPLGPRRSRDGAHLGHVEADARHWHDEFRGEGANSFPGVIGHHVLLVDPTRDQVLDALNEASETVERYAREEAFGGGEVQFAFAGHGSARGRLIVRDGELSGTEIVDAVLACPRTDPEKRQLALVLDSCHSARTLAEVMVDERRSTDFLLIDGLAASLHDELAWELDELGHGALTFSERGLRSLEPLERDRRLARAVREGDDDYIRMALAAHVPNPVTYLTQGEQNSIDVMNGHQMEIKGAGRIEVLDSVPVDVLLAALERARVADSRMEVWSTNAPDVSRT